MRFGILLTATLSGPRLPALLLASSLALGPLGCSRCSLLPSARLTERTGKVERSSDGNPEHWARVREVETFGSGDRLRTRAASFAQLSLDDGSHLTLEPETELQFLGDLGSGDPALNIVAGTGLLETSARGTRLRTSFGRIISPPGTRLELSGKPNSVTVHVQVGQVRVESRTGTVLEVTSPHGVELSSSGARLNLASEPPPPTSEPPPPRPSVSDVELRVGDSLVVHDPKPPTSVRFAFGPDCREGAVTLEGERARASASEWTDQGAVVVQIGAGSLDYHLQCRSGPGQPLTEHGRGNLTILEDSGTRPFDLHAPATTLDVTGRHYNVIYQHELPQVTLRWPDAPPSSRYLLSMSYLGKTRNHPAREPAYAFAPGELAEGTHQAQFSSGKVASDRTVIAIRLDPKASVLVLDKLPAAPEGAAAQPESLELTGTVWRGWSLSVEGQEVALDAQGRFHSNATRPPAGRPLGLWLRSPERQPHVYLVR